MKSTKVHPRMARIATIYISVFSDCVMPVNSCSKFALGFFSESYFVFFRKILFVTYRSPINLTFL